MILRLQEEIRMLKAQNPTATDRSELQMGGQTEYSQVAAQAECDHSSYIERIEELEAKMLDASELQQMLETELGLVTDELNEANTAWCKDKAAAKAQAKEHETSLSSIQHKLAKSEEAKDHEAKQREAQAKLLEELQVPDPTRTLFFILTLTLTLTAKLLEQLQVPD